jgi:sugar/nucleoside kinase (ribokinase family)
VATSLAKLGMDVVCITALGNDEPGDKLAALLKGAHAMT